MVDLDKKIRDLTAAQRRLLELRRTRNRNALADRRVDNVESSRSSSSESERSIDFGLLYFSSDGYSEARDKYGRLFETVRVAETLGFTAAWTPERHFQEFGGLFPNPAVLGAALARETKTLAIRAGSVVVPLHDPVRIVEEWALVDNLSGGRVGISLATGWNSTDFALRPDRFEERREITFKSVPLLRSLWRGETLDLKMPGGGRASVRAFPRPLQPELPLWLTVSGSDDTWQRAAKNGANVLTSLLGQTVDELETRISAYRRELIDQGHDQSAGKVTVMIHTFVHPDQDYLRRVVRQALGDYLRGYIRQYSDLAGKQGTAPLNATQADENALIDIALERFLNERALLGTAEVVRERCSRLRNAGVDEIACLVDFGLDSIDVLTSMERMAPILADLSLPKVALRSNQ